MKTVHFTCRWESHHEIEVDDDFDGGLMDLDEDTLMQVTSATAELVDWSDPR